MKTSIIIVQLSFHMHTMIQNTLIERTVVKCDCEAECNRNSLYAGAMIRSQLTYEFTHDYRIKLLVCGDSSVGKTSLLTRFVSDKFNLSQNRTVGKSRQTCVNSCINLC